MEIQYFPEGSKKTDYSVLLFGKPIGVSVTRAMKFSGKFTEEDAINLLEKKLLGIILSSENGTFSFPFSFFLSIRITNYQT